MVRILVIGLFILLQAGFVSSGTLMDESAFSHVKDGVCQVHEQNQSKDSSQLVLPAGSEGAFDGVKTFCIFSVIDGKVLKNTLTPDQLKAQNPVAIAGHVCGIVILCRDDTRIRVDGQEASRIRKDTDGACLVKFLGKMKPEQLGLPPLLASAREEGKKNPSGRQPKALSENFFAGAFSFFPRITGDLVSPNKEFNIFLESQGKVSTISVRQNGYQTLRTICREPECKQDRILIRYAGESLDRERPSDFDARLGAIIEGIHNVESTFGVELVNHINIIDYKETMNAVTCDEGTDIWFYTEAFLKEPINELKTIAEHESLHKLVSGMQFTTESVVRELFSDFRGFGEFSNERFMIMMSGFIRPVAVTKESEISPFFSFIDERNFLEGMNGGHSYESLEEFCTSFIHSLMSVDRLGPNLDHPIKLTGNPDHPRILTVQEKRDVLNKYVRSIEALIEALPDTEASGQQPLLPPGQTESFLNKCLNKARNIRKDWLMTRDEPVAAPLVR